MAGTLSVCLMCPIHHMGKRLVGDVVAAGDPHRADRVSYRRRSGRAGIVDSLARPGGNATGFSGLECGLSGKWLELLKEVAPEMTRAAVLRDPANPGGPALFGIIQAVAPSLRVEVIPINTRDAGEIERSVGAFAHSSIGGLIITPNRLRSRTVI